MRNYITQFAKTLKEFKDSNGMVEAIEFIRGEEDLEKMVFDRRTMLVQMLSADLDNEEGRPVYEVNYVIAMVDKSSPTAEYGLHYAVEECLWLIGRLQEKLQQLGWDAAFGPVDIVTDYDLAGDLVVLSSEVTLTFARGGSDLLQ